MDELVGALRGAGLDDGIRCIVLGGSERAFAAGADIGVLSQTTPVRGGDVEPARALGLDPQGRQADRRGRVGVLSRRRLRARDAVRPDRGLRDRAVRPAGDQPRPDARRGGHSTAHAGGRQGSRDGRDPVAGASFPRARRRRPGSCRASSSGRRGWTSRSGSRATIAEKSPLALRLAKQAVNRAFEGSLQLGVEYERQAFAIALGTEDAREGMSAFIEKRQPEFKGE